MTERRKSSDDKSLVLNVLLLSGDDVHDRMLISELYVCTGTCKTTV